MKHFVVTLSTRISWFLDRYMVSILIVATAYFAIFGSLSVMRTHIKRDNASHQEGRIGMASIYWQMVEQEAVK